MMMRIPYLGTIRFGETVKPVSENGADSHMLGRKRAHNEKDPKHIVFVAISLAKRTLAFISAKMKVTIDSAGNACERVAALDI